MLALGWVGEPGLELALDCAAGDRAARLGAWGLACGSDLGAEAGLRAARAWRLKAPSSSWRSSGLSPAPWPNTFTWKRSATSRALDWSPCSTQRPPRHRAAAAAEFGPAGGGAGHVRNRKQGPHLISLLETGLAEAPLLLGEYQFFTHLRLREKPVQGGAIDHKAVGHIGHGATGQPGTEGQHKKGTQDETGDQEQTQSPGQASGHENDQGGWNLSSRPKPCLRCPRFRGSSSAMISASAMIPALARPDLRVGAGRPTAKKGPTCCWPSGDCWPCRRVPD